jgi:hypothetical protein
LRFLSFARGQGRAWPSAGGVGYSVNPSRTIAACVSIDVDTSATFIAKRQSLRPKDDFALLKALCFAEGKAPIESQRSRNGYGSVHSEFFISRQPEGWVRITEPRQGIRWVWNSAPDEQAA